MDPEQTDNLDRLIANRSTQRRRPDDSTYLSLSWADEHDLAEIATCPLRQIEIRALKQEIVPERYCRNQQTLSCTDQLRLLQAEVAIIGLGGLGGTVVEILARIGIGSLILIDGDRFDESNLNRQLLSSIDTLGMPKAEVADRRVAAINPAIDRTPVGQFFTAENGPSLVQHCDLVVDCLDSIPSRLLVEHICATAGKPLVSAAIGGTSGQATTIYPGDRRLHSLYGNRGTPPSRGAEARLGTLPFAAVYMAAVQCAEVVNIVTGNSAQLRSRLFFAEINEHRTDLIELER